MFHIQVCFLSVVQQPGAGLKKHMSVILVLMSHYCSRQIASTSQYLQFISPQHHQIAKLHHSDMMMKYFASNGKYYCK